MIRILSALLLLPVVAGTVWFTPPLGTLFLAEVVLVLAFTEYADLAARLGDAFPRVVPGLATMACCAALGWWGVPVETILLSALVTVAATAVGAGRIGSETLGGIAAALLAPLYLGLPIGAFVAVRTFHGREAVSLLMLVVIASDTAQYYGGRVFGRRPLSPVISPRKTVEGAVAGLVAGCLVMGVVGRFWLPAIDAWQLWLFGATIAALGIVGDLFESLLKRAAGIKDSSGLIPGHGGLLDRLDSWLFAAPAYYVYLRFVS